MMRLTGDLWAVPIRFNPSCYYYGYRAWVEF
jgi:hypothetical protein